MWEERISELSEEYSSITHQAYIVDIYRDAKNFRLSARQARRLCNEMYEAQLAWYEKKDDIFWENFNKKLMAWDEYQSKEG